MGCSLYAAIARPTALTEEKMVGKQRRQVKSSRRPWTFKLPGKQAGNKIQGRPVHTYLQVPYK